MIDEYTPAELEVLASLYAAGILRYEEDEDSSPAPVVIRNPSIPRYGEGQIIDSVWE